MGPSRLLSLPESPVWVLEDQAPEQGARRGAPPPGASPAAAVAGRLGLPFRRIGAVGGAGRVPAGSLPFLVLSSGGRAAARALLLRARHGSLAVHCLQGTRWLPHRLLSGPFDLLVSPAPNAAAAGRRGAASRVLPTLGLPQPVSPTLLVRARMLWADRLSYLPWPRIALLVGGSAPDPASILALARQATGLARARGGCVLASATAECSTAMAEALSQGLAGGTHLLHRAGEPGPDPSLGFLGGADLVIVAWTGPLSLSEACAADGPVFLQRGVPARTRLLARQLLARDQIRLWDDPRAARDPFLPWGRSPLDEAGRIARTILRRYARLRDRSLETDPSGQA